MRRIGAGWTLLGLGILAGCATAGSAIIGSKVYSPGYTPGEARLGYGPVPVAISGSAAAGLSRARSDAAVLADMQNRGFFQTRFTLTPGSNAPYWVAVLFDPRPTVTADEACALGPARLPPPAALPPASGRVPVAMALCRGDTMLSGAYGTAPVPAGPGDPAFARAIGDFVMALIPSVNPINPPPVPEGP